jgi:hypothetical protein
MYKPLVAVAGAALAAAVALVMVFWPTPRGTVRIESDIPLPAPPPAKAPFTAQQARDHQQAWAKYLGVPVESTNKLGMKFRLIPPGEFTMGATDAEAEIWLTFHRRAPTKIPSGRSPPTRSA